MDVDTVHSIGSDEVGIEATGTILDLMARIEVWHHRPEGTPEGV